jgi:hypothetical protein
VSTKTPVRACGHSLACERCGSNRQEILWSSAAAARVCLRCHLRVSPETIGIEFGEQAGEIRADAHELGRFADSRGDRRLGSLAGRLGGIALLLEVGSERETPEQLLASAESLRSQGIGSVAR